MRYLTARGLTASQGLLRLDGLYGYARVAALLTRHGLGYLMRCADYRLFHRTVVQAVIAQPPHATYASPDSSVRRDAWQVLDLPWVAAKDPTDAVVTRLIITRRGATEPGKPRVGKRVGDHVFELFVTDRSASGWSIEDVLSVYLPRGGIEATQGWPRRIASATSTGPSAGAPRASRSGPSWASSPGMYGCVWAPR